MNYFKFALLFCIAGNLYGAQVDQKTSADTLQDFFRTTLRNNDVEGLKTLLPYADVNAPDARGKTPLMLADNPVIIQLLIKAGADVNAEDQHGWRALTHAAAHGNLEKAQLLIQAGAHIDARDHLYETPLMRAAYYNHIEMVKFLTKETLKKTGAMYHNTKEETINAAGEKNKKAIRQAIVEAVKEYEYHQGQRKLVEEQRQLIPVISDIISEYVGEEIPAKLHAPQATRCTIQ